MPERSPEVTPTCTRCGSEAVIPDAFLYYEQMGTMTLSVGVHRNPDAKILKQPVRSKLQYRVCGDCGLVEVEVEDPHALWDAHIDRLSREF